MANQTSQSVSQEKKESTISMMVSAAAKPAKAADTSRDSSAASQPSPSISPVSGRNQKLGNTAATPSSKVEELEEVTLTMWRGGSRRKRRKAAPGGSDCGGGGFLPWSTIAVAVCVLTVLCLDIAQASQTCPSICTCKWKRGKEMDGLAMSTRVRIGILVKQER